MVLPSFIKPKEILGMTYWVHLGILAFIVLALLQFFKGGSMLTVQNVLWSIPLLGVSDITAHSILQLN